VASEKPSLDTIVKEKAKTHGVGKAALGKAVEDEYVRHLAREIVEQIVAGSVEPPKRHARATWGTGRSRSRSGK